LPRTGAERTRDDLPGSSTDYYWQTPMPPDVSLHVPAMNPTFGMVVGPQHGVPLIVQLRPLGRQQLHLVTLPDLSVAQFVQQAPSRDRQWPLLVLYMAVPICLHNAVADDPDVHERDWQVSGVDPKRRSPVHASPSSQTPGAGTPRQPGTNWLLPTTATMAQ